MSRSTRFAIRMARQGCTNRPFYHIQVMPLRSGQHDPPIEQLGVYDPMPNADNEKIVSFNFERIRYWLSQDVKISDPVAELLGLCGFLPLFPRTYMKAWKNRRESREKKTITGDDKSSDLSKT